MNLSRTAAAALLAFGIAGPSAATPIFDSFSGGDVRTGATSRAAGSAPSARITVTEQVSIGGIAIRADLGDANGGNLAFFIFDLDASDLLYLSGPKFFADDGLSWKRSDDFALSLLPGIEYGIGAIADVVTQYTYDFAGDTHGPITSAKGNVNVASFDEPTVRGVGSVDIPVQLFAPQTVQQTANAVAVPEPAAWLLLVVGLLTAATVRTRLDR